ncbi:MAG: hemerythrin family protein [Alphaproteobacteria bacterium]|nr:hemerythrin family protein [Alphaproteobacteria bacterium]
MSRTTLLKRGCGVKPIPIVWTEALSVGISELDDGHKRLIDLVNTLFENAFSEGAPRDMEKAVARLMAHTLAHFAHEEAYLHSHDPAACTRHQAEHIRLFAELEAICKRLLREGGKELDSATAAFLRQWMVAHIMSHDKRDSALLLQAS